MNEPQHETRAIFLEALALNTPEERASHLDAACRDKPALRQRVEALLRAHDQAGDFLKPVPLAGELGFFQSSISEGPGTIIGHYKLLEPIGEGGFGVVFMAEQIEPIRRRVAIKVIKPGMDTREVIARFEAERQALALMDHPNIARVFDAGATDTGRPYFVMELVPGVPITRFCDANDLSPNERLCLFQTVCEAVQHAHQKGIIHRDLKPSNILVTLHDGKPVPKVIDFGTAKALQHPLTEKTLFTAFGRLIGTPQYMSPEQAELSGLDVDTRADIYSLGVLLYELLTGTTPFEADQLRSAAFEEMLRIIREEEPPKPSTRVSTLGERATAVAGHRKVDPAVLRRTLRGDLDWIVMKALEKDRTRRYDTASALVEDLQHHLDHEPVLASPPGKRYRTRKFIRRHRMGVALAASVTIALLAGLAVSLIGFAKAKREGLRARQEAAIAEAVKQFLQQDLLEQAQPDSQPDRDVKLRTLVNRAADKVGKRFQDNPLVEAEIRQTLGAVYGNLGEYPKARIHLDRALDIYQRHLPAEDRRLLDARISQAYLLKQEGRHHESQILFEQLIPVYKRVLGAEHWEVLDFSVCLADIHVSQGNFTEAQQLAEETLATGRRVLGMEHKVTLSCMNELAHVYLTQDKISAARELYEEILAIRRRRLGTDDAATAEAMADLAVSYQFEGRLAEAQQLQEQALPILRRVYGAEHPQTLGLMSALARTCQEQGRLVEAGKLMEEVLPAERRILGPEHHSTLISMGLLASIYERQMRFDEADPLHKEGVVICRRTLGPEHPSSVLAAVNWATCYLNAGKGAEAQKLLEEAIPDVRRLFGSEHSYTLQAMNNLGGAYLRQGKLSDSAKLFEEILKVQRKKLGEEHAETLFSKFKLFETYQKLGQKAKALVLAQELLQATPAIAGSETQFLLCCMLYLAEMLPGLGKPVEARTLYEQTLAGFERELGPEHTQTIATMNTLAWLLATCKDPQVRNGPEALRLAQRAVAATGHNNGSYLSTLAAAYAEVGDFPKAVTTQQEAIEHLPKESWRSGFEARLKLYESNKPFREP